MYTATQLVYIIAEPGIYVHVLLYSILHLLYYIYITVICYITGHI